MLYIGVDIGVTGAVGAVDREGQLIDVVDLPITNYGKFKWTNGLELVAILRKLRDKANELTGETATRVFLEYVHAQPRLGCSTANAMGRTFGSAVAAVQIAGLSFELVSPQKWKKALNMSNDKRASLDFARARWPDADLARMKDHNRAEALLIAEYGRRFNTGAV